MTIREILEKEICGICSEFCIHHKSIEQAEQQIRALVVAEMGKCDRHKSQVVIWEDEEKMIGTIGIIETIKLSDATETAGRL